jgi:glycosyltransferase involved in cell wall biosynthesis
MSTDGDSRVPLELSIIVSTIGRPAALARLVDSLGEQDAAGAGRFELIVVDQSADRGCLALLDKADPPFRWAGAVSARGVSRGRNKGLSMASGRIIAVPDDNCWYAANTIGKVLGAMPKDGGRSGVSGVQLTDDGAPSMLRWPRTPRRLNRRSVWRAAISSTIFLPRDAVLEVGGFDESLGVGADSPWQAGEDTDLLLRVMAAGVTMRFNPVIRVMQDDPRSGRERGFEQKMLGYGRGVGRVHAKNGYAPARVLALLARKTAAAAVRTSRGRPDLAAADLAWARGLWQGYRGVLV